MLGVFVALVAQMSSPGKQLAVHERQRLGSGAALKLLSVNAPYVAAVAGYAFDANSGAVLFSKDANQELPMASCTKIMTALLAVEHGNLDQVITAGADAHALVRSDSSYMGVSTGEKLTLRDLLYGLVMPSGNDAAVAIADAIGGTRRTSST